MTHEQKLRLQVFIATKLGLLFPVWISIVVSDLKASNVTQAATLLALEADAGAAFSHLVASSSGAVWTILLPTMGLDRYSAFRAFAHEYLSDAPGVKKLFADAGLGSNWAVVSTKASPNFIPPGATLMLPPWWMSWMPLPASWPLLPIWAPPVWPTPWGKKGFNHRLLGVANASSFLEVPSIDPQVGAPTYALATTKSLSPAWPWARKSSAAVSLKGGNATRIGGSDLLAAYKAWLEASGIPSASFDPAAFYKTWVDSTKVLGPWWWLPVRPAKSGDAAANEYHFEVVALPFVFASSPDLKHLKTVVADEIYIDPNDVKASVVTPSADAAVGTTSLVAHAVGEVNVVVMVTCDVHGSPIPWGNETQPAFGPKIRTEAMSLAAKRRALRLHEHIGGQLKQAAVGNGASKSVFAMLAQVCHRLSAEHGILLQAGGARLVDVDDAPKSKWESVGCDELIEQVLSTNPAPLSDEPPTQPGDGKTKEGAEHHEPVPASPNCASAMQILSQFRKQERATELVGTQCGCTGPHQFKSEDEAVAAASKAADKSISNQPMTAHADALAFSSNGTNNTEMVGPTWLSELQVRAANAAVGGNITADERQRNEAEAAAAQAWRAEGESSEKELKSLRQQAQQQEISRPIVGAAEVAHVQLDTKTYEDGWAGWHTPVSEATDGDGEHTIVAANVFRKARLQLASMQPTRLASWLEGKRPAAGSSANWLHAARPDYRAK